MQQQIQSQIRQPSIPHHHSITKIPQIQADPVPDMPTIDMRKEDNESKISKTQTIQLSLAASRQSNTNLCNIEQLLFQHIYECNLDQLKGLKIHLRDLNYLEEFEDEFIDQQIFPLALAVSTGQIDVVKLLLQNESIDINLQTEPQGLTALKIACSNGYYELAELLVAQGADVNQQNNQGSVPLFYCFSRLEEEQNYFENKQLCFKMAELLIENGADIDSVVNLKKGYSLLMLFCASKEKMNQRDLQVNLDVIKFLILSGADKDKQTDKGKKAIDLIGSHPAKETVKLMLLDLKQKGFQKKLNMRPHVINQQQVVKMEGRVAGSNCCCSLMSSSNRNKNPVKEKQWWKIF